MSLAGAQFVVRLQGKGVTYGLNKHGGIVHVAPGKLTLEQLKSNPEVVAVKYEEPEGN